MNFGWGGAIFAKFLSGQKGANLSKDFSKFTPGPTCSAGAYSGQGDPGCGFQRGLESIRSDFRAIGISPQENPILTCTKALETTESAEVAYVVLASARIRRHEQQRRPGNKNRGGEKKRREN